MSFQKERVTVRECDQDNFLKGHMKHIYMDRVMSAWTQGSTSHTHHDTSLPVTETQPQWPNPRGAHSSHVTRSPQGASPEPGVAFWQWHSIPEILLPWKAATEVHSPDWKKGEKQKIKGAGLLHQENNCFPRSPTQQISAYKTLAGTWP